MTGMNVSEQTIQVNGLPVHYRVVGQGEPVVFVHGLSGSSRWWNRNVPAIAERHRVYLVDLPGFGTMRRFHWLFGLKRCVIWLDKWMEAVGLEMAHLVGHSMGGYICMALATRKPQKVKRLVLVASIGIPFNCSVNRLFFPMVKAMGRTNPAFWPYLVYDYFRAGPQMVRRASQEVVDLDATTTISSVTVPTLLIWGANDDLVNLDFGHQMHKLLAKTNSSGTRLLILQKANHICMFDRPHDFNKALLAFLQGQEVGVPAIPPTGTDLSCP
jgi:pimeloyl-ACP methyl ester carboxylesterase